MINSMTVQAVLFYSLRCVLTDVLSMTYQYYVDRVFLLSHRQIGPHNCTQWNGLANTFDPQDRGGEETKGMTSATKSL